MVVGSAAVAEQSHGVVRAFASRTDSLLKRMYLARKAALTELRTTRPDLIASHFALYGAPIADWARKMPFVVHFHGPWAAESGVERTSSLAHKLKLSLERRVYETAQICIVLSSAFRQELVTHFDIPEQRIRVIPGGIDTVRFNNTLSRNEARKLLGWPTDRPILLGVRRLVRRMGLENLIDAMEAVSTNCPEALLFLGGTGPLADALQRRIREKGLQSQVQLLGRVPEEDLPVAYRAADFSVVPTQALEGFGMITLESLSSGTPVLVTPVGGLPEVVQPFAPACVFADTTVRELTTVITEILKGTRPLPSEQACRDYAVNHFAWPQIASRVSAVYREASGL